MSWRSSLNSSWGGTDTSIQVISSEAALGLEIAPAAFLAETRNWYVLSASTSALYAQSTTLLKLALSHFPAETSLRSIMYSKIRNYKLFISKYQYLYRYNFNLRCFIPVIAAPPSNSGAFHPKSTCDFENDVTATSRGSDTCSLGIIRSDGRPG